MYAKLFLNSYLYNSLVASHRVGMLADNRATRYIMDVMMIMMKMSVTVMMGLLFRIVYVYAHALTHDSFFSNLLL